MLRAAAGPSLRQAGSLAVLFQSQKFSGIFSNYLFLGIQL
jgi:hypothetical protein